MRLSRLSREYPAIEPFSLAYDRPVDISSADNWPADDWTGPWTARGGLFLVYFRAFLECQ